MIFLTNVLDPNNPITKDKYHTVPDEDMEQTRDRFRTWLESKTIGDPIPTTFRDALTLEELKAQGFIGVYLDIKGGDEIRLATELDPDAPKGKTDFDYLLPPEYRVPVKNPPPDMVT